MIAFQELADPSSAPDFVANLQTLGWIDKTALGVLLVFFVLGLFKGLIWQVSRIGILVAAYFIAGRFGHDVAGMLSSTPPEQLAETAMASGEVAPGETTLYLAYCLLFVAVLIVLSLLAMLVKRLADKAGLSFFDRLGGGVLGVATGACVVLAGIFAVNMFFPTSDLARAAETSHTKRWSQTAVDWLGSAVNDDLRSVLALQRLQSRDPGTGRQGEGRQGDNWQGGLPSTPPKDGQRPQPGQPGPETGRTGGIR